MSNSLPPHGLQHYKLPYSSPPPGVCSNSCPLSYWCYLTISSSAPLSLLPSIFPSIRVFSIEWFLHIWWPKYWSFSISPSTEYSVLISFMIDCLISLQSKGLSRVFSNTIVQNHRSLALSFLYGPTLTSIHDYWKNYSFD